MEGGSSNIQHHCSIIHLQPASPACLLPLWSPSPGNWSMQVSQRFLLCLSRSCMVVAKMIKLYKFGWLFGIWVKNFDCSTDSSQAVLHMLISYSPLQLSVGGACLHPQWGQGGLLQYWCGGTLPINLSLPAQVPLSWCSGAILWTCMGTRAGQWCHKEVCEEVCGVRFFHFTSMPIKGFGYLSIFKS